MREMTTFGVDRAICVLVSVSGPCGNLLDDFSLVVDLIAQEKATAWIEKRIFIDRWRDAASSRPAQPATSGVGLNTGVDFSSDRRRGGYHVMHVPGA